MQIFLCPFSTFSMDVALNWHFLQRELVNYSRSSDSYVEEYLKINKFHFRRKMSPIWNSFECLKMHCIFINWTIWTQKVPTEAWMYGIRTNVFLREKIFCFTWTVGHELWAVKNWFCTVHMVYHRCFFLLEIYKSWIFYSLPCNKAKSKLCPL